MKLKQINYQPPYVAMRLSLVLIYFLCFSLKSSKMINCFSLMCMIFFPSVPFYTVLIPNDWNSVLTLKRFGQIHEWPLTFHCKSNKQSCDEQLIISLQNSIKIKKNKKIIIIMWGQHLHCNLSSQVQDKDQLRGLLNAKSICNWQWRHHLFKKAFYYSYGR